MTNWSCATCRWWEDRVEFGKVCLLISGQDCAIAYVAIDGERPRGEPVLYTQPDFGCNQWAEKDRDGDSAAKALEQG